MIFKLFGFLFVFLIAILLIGLSIIGTVIRRILGMGGKTPGNTRTSGSQQTSRQETFRQKETQQPPKKKVFDDDEGEYVEFEEVREEK